MKPTSSQSDLTLLVQQEGRIDQEVFLQHGITIGRAASNMICIEDSGVELIHARVLRQADGSFILQAEDRATFQIVPSEDGSTQTTDKAALQADLILQIGKTKITCLKQKTHASAILAESLWEAACPKCQSVISDQSETEQTCSSCSLPLFHHESKEFTGWLPRKLGPYEIRKFVAKGGMGVVLQGIHENRHSYNAFKYPITAIKIPNPEITNDEKWRKRFLSEIKVIRRFSHNNIAKYIDSGQEGSLLWYAMEWVSGERLDYFTKEAIRKKTFLNLESIKTTILQIIAGLRNLHEHNIIHRDLKPSNIIINNDGVVKITDFGIAKSKDTENSLLTTATFAGTAQYMAPEQWMGQPLSFTADIYALGVIWHELLTNKKPKPGKNNIYVLRSNSPFSWCTVIYNCLDQNPEKRPNLILIKTSLEMGAYKNPVINDNALYVKITPIPSNKFNVVETSKNYTDNSFRKKLAKLCVMPKKFLAVHPWKGEIKISVFTVCLCVAFYIGSITQNNNQNVTKTNTEKGPLFDSITDSIRRDSKKRSGSLLWKFYSKSGFIATPALGNLNNIIIGGSDQNIYSLEAGTGKAIWKFHTEGKISSSPSITSSGEIFIGSNDGNLYSINELNGTKNWSFKTDGAVVSTPAIGSDGKVYAGSVDNRIYAIDTNSGIKQWEYETNGSINASPSISSDGIIYIGSLDHFLYAFNENGVKLWDYKTEGPIYSSVAVDLDSTIYFGSLDSKFYALNGNTGKLKWSYASKGEIRSSPVIYKNEVLFGSYDGTLYALNIYNGEYIWHFNTKKPIFSSPAIGSDNTIYFAAMDNILYSVDIEERKINWKYLNNYQKGAFFSSIMIGDKGAIYAATTGGYLFSIKSSSPEVYKSPWPLFRQNRRNTGHSN